MTGRSYWPFPGDTIRKIRLWRRIRRKRYPDAWRLEEYNNLVSKIREFFETGIGPVTTEETLGIFTQAAEEHKMNGGIPLEMEGSG